MENQQVIWFAACMTKVPIFLFMMLVMIAGFMMSLLNSGISLRVATLIKPSEISSTKQVAQALAIRLFPELQTKKWLIYSFENESPRAKELLVEFLAEVKKTPAGEYQVRVAGEECEKHCLFLDETPQNHETVQQIFSVKLEAEQSDVFRLKVGEFDLQEPFLQECDSMQRLDEQCIRAISIRDSRRKMKNPDQKYFFLKKYNHNQYYLFFQK